MIRDHGTMCFTFLPNSNYLPYLRCMYLGSLIPLCCGGVRWIEMDRSALGKCSMAVAVITPCREGSVGDLFVHHKRYV